MLLTILMAAHILGVCVLTAAIVSVHRSVDFEANAYCERFTDVTKEDLVQTKRSSSSILISLCYLLLLLLVPGCAILVGVCLFATMDQVVPEYVSRKAAEIRAARSQEKTDEGTGV